MSKLLAKLAARGEGIEAYERPRSGIHSSSPEDGIKKTQKLLLTWLCDDPAVYRLIGKYLTADDFTEEIYRKAAAMLFEQIEKDEINFDMQRNNTEQTDLNTLDQAIKNKKILQEIQALRLDLPG